MVLMQDGKTMKNLTSQVLDLWHFDPSSKIHLVSVRQLRWKQGSVRRPSRTRYDMVD
jgi:hypothetical protein